MARYLEGAIDLDVYENRSIKPISSGSTPSKPRILEGAIDLPDTGFDWGGLGNNIAVGLNAIDNLGSDKPKYNPWDTKDITSALSIAGDIGDTLKAIPGAFKTGMGTYIRNPKQAVKDVARTTRGALWMAPGLIPIGEPKDQADVAMERLGQGLTADAPIVASTIANPLRTAIGVGSFMGLNELQNVLVSKVKNKDYKPLSYSKISELLPDETPEFVKGVADATNFVAQVALLHKAGKVAPEIGTKLTKDFTATYNPPKTISISGADIKDIFQTGTKLSTEANQFIRDLRLDAKGYRDLFTTGVKIDIPIEKITTMTDKPYWGKVKKLFGQEPVNVVTKTSMGKATKAPLGLLPESTEQVKNVTFPTQSIPAQLVKAPTAVAPAAQPAAAPTGIVPITPKAAPIEAIKPVYRGVSPAEWESIQKTGKVEGLNLDNTLGSYSSFTENKNVADAHRSLTDGYMVEFKPEAVNKLQPDIGGQKGNFVGRLTKDDIVKVTDKDGNVIFDVNKSTAPQEVRGVEAEYDKLYNEAENARKSIKALTGDSPTEAIFKLRNGQYKTEEGLMIPKLLQKIQKFEDFEAGLTDKPGAYGGFLAESTPSITGKGVRGVADLQSFENKYVAQHKDLRSVGDVAQRATEKSIRDTGMKEGMNVNALPISVGREYNPNAELLDYPTRKFGNKKGDVIYLLPKEAVISGKNGYKIKAGFKPSANEVVRIEYDGQSTYDAWKTQLSPPPITADNAPLLRGTMPQQDMFAGDYAPQIEKMATPGKWTNTPKEPIKAYEDIKPTVGEATGFTPSVETPELLKFARELLGDKISVSNLRTHLGQFRHSKLAGEASADIKLDREVFKDPIVFGKTLAHEIGHLVDWLPDKTLSRGNILGRIGVLKKYMKKTLEEFPGSGGELTPKDRARLHREAEALATGSEDAEKLDTSFNPQAVLDVWNNIENKTPNETLLAYIKSLSSSQKSSIIKSAIQAIRKGEKLSIPDINNFNNAYTRDIKSVQKIYEELIRKEIIKRKLYDVEQIKKELKDVAQYWNPWDERNVNFTKYKLQPKELYAEAISVLLNQPAKLAEIAPQFYKGFWAHLDKKPEVVDALSGLDKILNPTDKLSARSKDIEGMFAKGEAALHKKRTESLNKKNDIWLNIKTQQIDRNSYIYDREKKVLKDVKLNPDDNPRYYLEELSYIGGKIKNLTQELQYATQPALDAGVTNVDIGKYLMLKRIVSERSGIANPLGQNPITAQDQLDFMKQNLGEEKFKALEGAVTNIRGIASEVMNKYYKAGGISQENYLKMIENPDYSTFQVLDYVDDYIAPQFMNQKGTLKDISNPYPATVMKLISVIRATERIKTNNSIVKFMTKYYPDEISLADTKFVNRYRRDPIKKDNMGVMSGMVDGKPVWYDVDPYLENMVKSQPIAINNIVLDALGMTNSKYFRPVYVSLNLGFQTYNAIRDFKRLYKTSPDVNILQLGSEYAKSFKAVKNSVKNGVIDPVLGEMQDKGMMSLSFNDVLRSENPEEEEHIDYLMRIYDTLKDKPKENIALKIMNFVEDMGDIVEKTAKRTGYVTRVKYAKDLNPRVAAHEVRNLSGSPDFLQKGAANLFNNKIMLFYNAIKQGIRSDIEAVTNPRTRFTYAYRTMIMDIIPKLVMFLGAAGLFGEKIKENYDKQSEYDKTNFTSIPVGFTGDGKAISFVIPSDETGRFIGGLFWKLLTKNKDPKESATELLSLTGGQVPSASPAIELAYNTIMFMSGKNPYDFFTQKPMFSTDEMLAATPQQKTTKFLSSTGQTLGLGGVVNAARVATGDLKYGSPLEGILKNIPILRRFLRVSDAGQKQKQFESYKPRMEMGAKRRLQRKEARK